MNETNSFYVSSEVPETIEIVSCVYMVAIFIFSVPANIGIFVLFFNSPMVIFILTFSSRLTYKLQLNVAKIKNSKEQIQKRFSFHKNLNKHNKSGLLCS